MILKGLMVFLAATVLTVVLAILALLQAAALAAGLVLVSLVA